MTHDEFGTRERALLIALMALGGSASNPELREAFGDALDGAPRRRMNDLGLVESVKERSFRHELTDKGWAWCAEELSAVAPPRAGSLGRALFCVLGALRNSLDDMQLSLGEFIVRNNAAPAGDDLETRIREAYWSLAKEPQDWVLLTAVRPLLGAAARADVDAVLSRMGRLPDVNFAPEADQKTLTDEDRAAALRIGGKDKHLLSIEAR
ncbi:hypothetical protein [Actinomadura rayongensis]|uniref:Uncharacterized protein n=1 Tax=Actinomadura rayongensis TaxID=1429076 RepID=A0A6I4W8C9_9ACTN|nr:hypothetical protein [Actinomadura rayongensis]MXQ65741.1 hypothetical protein [Actinomadura rayongensis]